MFEFGNLSKNSAPLGVEWHMFAPNGPKHFLRDRILQIFRSYRSGELDKRCRSSATTPLFSGAIEKPVEVDYLRPDLIFLARSYYAPFVLMSSLSSLPGLK